MPSVTAVLEVPMDAKRVTVRISSDAWESLTEQSEIDGITISDRVGALVELWHTDQGIRDQSEPVAIRLSRESRRRRYGRQPKDT